MELITDKKKKSSAWRKKCGVALGGGAVLLTLFLVQEKAQAQETVVRLDQFFNSMAQRSELEEGRTMVVNGQPLDLDIFTVPMSQASTKVHLESWCQSDDRSPYDPTERYDGLAVQKLPLHWVSSSRLDMSVGCLKTNAKSTFDFIERVDKALTHDDFAYVGDFYYYKLDGKGDSTRVIAIKNGEGFDVKQIFKSEGDVLGGDLPDLDRPDGSRRIYAFGEKNEAGVSLIYENDNANKDEVGTHYKQEFKRKGFELKASEEDDKGNLKMLVEKENRLLAVVVWESKQKAYSALSIVSVEDTL